MARLRRRPRGLPRVLRARQRRESSGAGAGGRRDAAHPSLRARRPRRPPGLTLVCARRRARETNEARLADAATSSLLESPSTPPSASDLPLPLPPRSPVSSSCETEDIDSFALADLEKLASPPRAARKRLQTGRATVARPLVVFFAF